MQKDKKTEKPEPMKQDTDNIEALRKALDEEKERADKNLVSWQRTQADFINYKRRSEQEKEEMKQFANSVLICNLLPVLDDLERASSSVPEELAELPWVEGVRLIERKFHDILETQGVTPIKAKGKPFDPNMHEAAMKSEGREGMVVKELQRGYKLRDRVLRPSQVAVGSKDVVDEAGGPCEDVEGII